MDLHLETVFDSLEDGLVVIDDQRQPVWLNRAGGRLLGVDPQILQPNRPYPPALRQFIEKLELSTGTDPIPSSKAIQRFRLGTGGPDGLPVEVILTTGQLEGRRAVIACIRDVSSRQQMEKAVYDARKSQAIGALANGIAHDFTNILTAVISQIDLVLAGAELPPSLRQHLIYAQTSARRGAELVAKLQAFSRQRPTKFEVVDFAEVVDQALYMLRHSVPPAIEIRSPSFAGVNRPCRVNADTNQLLQVILNLGLNAREAMPKGGTISLTLEDQTFAGAAAQPPKRPGEFACLRISDTGHGMSPDVLARVFDPYFSTKDLSHGPGLALSMASSVIAEHGGWIEVTSREGEGSCFSIYLPRCVSLEAPKPVAPPETTPAEGHERILVVDDEELVRMVTKAVLAYRGYQISEAEDGEEAIQKYADSNPRFDLVLMDLHMPRLNGYDALRRIRAINPKLKAILLSGGTQDPAILGEELADVAYLQKPFDNHELANVVRRQLDRAP